MYILCVFFYSTEIRECQIKCNTYNFGAFGRQIIRGHIVANWFFFIHLQMVCIFSGFIVPFDIESDSFLIPFIIFFFISMLAFFLLLKIILILSKEEKKKINF